MREEWRKMGEKGVTPEEFNAAKEYLLASYNLRFASIGDIADILTAMQKEELGIDFLQKETIIYAILNFRKLIMQQESILVTESCAL